MKNKFIYIGKVIISGIIAFIILTLFCYFYYNVPVHSENNSGSTDYKWEPNVFYSRGTEGFACGKTNNDGFTNMFDYDENMQIDVLIMGSSHMEAYQVAMEESAASRLNSLLENNTVYNIGVSGHTFLTCSCNLEAAVKEYRPKKYVIMETGSISFSDDELIEVLDWTKAEIPSHSGGIVGFLQQNQFLRLLYKQLGEIQKGSSADIEENTNNQNETIMNDIYIYELLQELHSTCENADTYLIIVYHPGVSVNYDGSIEIKGDPKDVQQFDKLCKDTGIIFLDMSDRFKNEYDKDFTLPYGFSNSSVGAGHLNKYGHEMIADELYRIIEEVG